MLFFGVFAKLHSRRFVSPPPRDLCGRRLPRPCRGGGVYPKPPRRASDGSIPFIFQTLNFQLLTFNLPPSVPPLSPLSATLRGSPRMCCKQKTYERAKPFRCNTYAKPGGGVELLGDVSAVPMQ